MQVYASGVTPFYTPHQLPCLLSGNVIVSLPLQYLHATVLNNNVILLLVINESFLFVYRNYHVNK